MSNTTTTAATTEIGKSWSTVLVPKGIVDVDVSAVKDVVGDLFESTEVCVLVLWDVVNGVLIVEGVMKEVAVVWSVVVVVSAGEDSVHKTLR